MCQKDPLRVVRLSKAPPISDSESEDVAVKLLPNSNSKDAIFGILASGESKIITSEGLASACPLNFYFGILPCSLLSSV